jgi:hypothetical protein
MDQNFPLTGNLTEVYLSEILKQLQSIRATGALTIERAKQIKSIYFKDGQIVFASSNLEEDRLGETLLKAGKLSHEQYEKSVEALKATGKRQGAVLVELGFLTPKGLFEGLKYQVLEILYSLFLWTEGSFRFVTCDLPRQVIPLEIELVTLLTEAIKRVEQSQAA